MPTFLVENTLVLATMDFAPRERPRKPRLWDGVIEKMGSAAQLARAANSMRDTSELLALPGAIDCHLVRP